MEKVFFFVIQENMYGSRIVYMKEIGSTIVCMGKERSPGLMEDATKVNINMIKNTGLELSCGQMKENMSVIGRTASNMVEANTIFPGERRKSVNGSKEKRSNGLNKLQAKKRL